jgi:two-component system LytT family response regulator
MKTIIHLPTPQTDFSFQELNRKIYSLEKRLDELMQAKQVLVIKTIGDIYFVQQDEIMFVQADSNYARIHISDGRKILASKTLKYIHLELSEEKFIRVHQSFLVNIDHIISCRCGSKKVICLKGGIEIPVSKRYFVNIMQVYSK